MLVGMCLLVWFSEKALVLIGEDEPGFSVEVCKDPDGFSIRERYVSLEQGKFNLRETFFPNTLRISQATTNWENFISPPQAT